MAWSIHRTVDRRVSGALVASYLHGSAALGGFHPQRSDVDLLMVAEDTTRPDADLLRGLAAEIASVPGPSRGIELSIVGRSQAAAPGAPWPFVLHVTTDPADAKVVIGRDHAGDPDLVMHYAVVRAAGVAVAGPAAAEVIGEVDRAAILGQLVGELEWGLQHAGEAYTVLNAGRALAYLHHGELISKLDGAEHAIAAGAPDSLVRRAVEVQSGGREDRRLTPPAVAFVPAALDELRRAREP